MSDNAKHCAKASFSAAGQHLCPIKIYKKKYNVKYLVSSYIKEPAVQFCSLDWPTIEHLFIIQKRRVGKRCKIKNFIIFLEGKFLLYYQKLVKSNQLARETLQTSHYLLQESQFLHYFCFCLQRHKSIPDLLHN